MGRIVVGRRVSYTGLGRLLFLHRQKDIPRCSAGTLRQAVVAIANLAADLAYASSTRATYGSARDRYMVAGARFRVWWASARCRNHLATVFLRRMTSWPLQAAGRGPGGAPTVRAAHVISPNAATASGCRADGVARSVSSVIGVPLASPRATTRAL